MFHLYIFEGRDRVFVKSNRERLKNSQLVKFDYDLVPFID